MKLYLFEGLVDLPALVNGDGLLSVVVMIDKEQTVAEQLSHLVEHQQVVNAGRQCRLVDGKDGAALDGLEIMQRTTTEHGNAQLRRVGQSAQLQVGLQLFAHGVEMEGTAGLLGLWQVEGVVLAAPWEAGR